MTDTSDNAPRSSNGNHERWLAETWRMIEDCAKDNSDGHRVSLSAKGCAALLAERRSIETGEPRAPSGHVGGCMCSPCREWRLVQYANTQKASEERS